ncbi:MAG: hypothetical protein IJW58_02800 [Clostridia bacterium]|nr:hypothetical protein [Clostridia bacterium]
MKKIKTKIINLALCASLLFGVAPTSGCAPNAKTALKGTALAEALLSKERINHEHLSQSFDFLDNRLNESSVTPVSQETNLLVKPAQAVASATTISTANERAGTSKGEIISGSGDTAVYSWSNFERLVTELHYFKSHFSAGQERTDKVDGNISFLENHTDLKNKWVKGISYIDYLMQVEENRELIYENDVENETYSVGIRTVNDEINTTYEYYENQGNTAIRTLATPDRRYEYTTVIGEEVTAFVADNDNGYWRFTQLYSWKGENLSLNVLVMTDELAYSFRYSITESSIYPSEITLVSPDLKYEIARINGSQITVYPGSFTGINELRVSSAEQIALGDYGNWIGYTSDYGYYSTYAAPHIYTDKGVLNAPTPCEAVGGGSTTIPTTLDENVDYVQGSVGGLWEQVYPKLVFEVKGDDVVERLENLHVALAKYDVEPIYDKEKVGDMATDMLKLIDGYNEHYTWNGKVLSTYENAMSAYATEKSKLNGYETLFTNAKSLPSATKEELASIQKNASFPAISVGSDVPVSVTNGKITLNGLSVTMPSNAVLEQNKGYVLKLALKKNNDALEELAVLESYAQDVATTYTGGTLTLSLSGEFDLPTDVAEGEYSVVAYVATADSGIRVSKFQNVLCVGEVNDKVTLEGMKIYTTITAKKVLSAKYEKIFDVSVTLMQGETPYAYEQVLGVMENAILDKGYFMVDAKLEAYDTTTHVATPVSEDSLSIGVYRLAYLGQFDGGRKVVAYIYCEIK